MRRLRVRGDDQNRRGLASAADLSGDGGGRGGIGSGREARAAAGAAAAAAAANSSSSASSACSSLGDLAALAAEALLPAFNVASPKDATWRLLLPVSEVDLGSGEPLASDVAAFGPDGASGTALLAEAGSLAPEFWRAGYWRAASELERGKKGGETASGIGGGAKVIAAAGATAVDAILSANDFREAPLPPTTLSLSDATAAWSERHTVGGRTDSYYEYLLKMWLMLRRAAAEEEDGGEVEVGRVATASSHERNSSPSTSSPLASGFVRDRKAEAEALSYISSSPPLPVEEKHRSRSHSRHRHPGGEKQHGREKSLQATTPLARRAETYRRAWLAAVDKILEKLVRETAGGSKYPKSDMGVSLRFRVFYIFSFRQEKRDKER